MLALLLIYGYLSLTAYVWGFAFLRSLLRIHPEWECSQASSNYFFAFPCIVLYGLACLAVVLQWLHFLIPVGGWMHLIVFAVSVLAFAWYRREFTSFFYLQINRLGRLQKFLWIIFALTTLLQSLYLIDYPTDESAYYLPTIRWLTQYPEILGLGNVSVLYAYHSSWFLLQAFFGFFFVMPGFFNDLNAFLLVIFFWFYLDAWSALKEHKAEFHHYLWLGLMLSGSFYFRDFLFTATVDFPVILLSFLDLFLFWDRLRRNQSTQDEQLITCLSIFAFSVKLSALPLLILPFFLMVKKSYSFLFFKKYAEFKSARTLLALLLVIIFPFLLKNYWTSGYVFSPLRFPDIFEVDWKIRSSESIGSTHIFQAFTQGKALDGMTNRYIPTGKWYYLHFFHYTTGFTQFFYLLLLIAPFVWLGYYYFFLRSRLEASGKWGFWVLIFALLAGLFFWLFLLPAWYWAGLKIAAGFLFFLVAGIPAILMSLLKLYKNQFWKWTNRLVAAGFVLLVCKGFADIPYQWKDLQKHLWMPPAFKVPSTRQIQHKKAVFNILSAKEDALWFAPQPCFQEDNLHYLELRGEDTSEGFRYSPQPLVLKPAKDR